MRPPGVPKRRGGARLSSMPRGRWLDRSQPQTLLIASVLLYINAGLAIIFLEFLNPIGAAFIVGQVASALGIANDKKWGYWLAVGVSVLILAFILISLGAGLINLIFQVALVALLLHPQSREYKRIWFK